MSMLISNEEELLTPHGLFKSLRSANDARDMGQPHEKKIDS